MGINQLAVRQFIQDKHGKLYSVVSSDDELDYKRFNIEYHDQRVGYVDHHFEGEEVLFIDDLHIDENAMRPPWFFLNLIFWIGSFPPEKWRVTNYQQRGLGTAMIKFLTDYARSNGAKRIEGEVKQHDFNDNPDLPDWYRRRGFYVVMGDENNSWVAKISLPV